ncbi:mobilization protein MobX [Escherichia coli]|uniref:mobilization protein MobX n=2 Tax=Escherichia coli TaxID=562 RepID=UPI00183440CB|nr:mobilization protein MobX [Escherichia coli]ELD0470264.1 mobilization protein MobX [Escherichia coli]ELJ7007824.1 mobilization protein MobX [Escherichia coli]HAH5410791.1 mobilization protein MobX [Escherichia coli]HCJ5832461.1 mobilization protein MobX [Escherichia coli]
MSDDIKQIAALIGHHQALEKRVTSLTEQFQSASAQLQQQSETLSRVIRELDSASGNMTDTVRKSVNAALTQIEKELKQAGLAQQKPATDALNQAADMAKAMIHEMRSEMSRYTWKSAIYLVLTILFVMAACVTAFTWFMNDGYSHIAEMQRMEAVWQKKAPLADISRCDGKPCVKVDTRTTYGDKENTWMIIKK